MTLSFEEARRCVIERARRATDSEVVPVAEAASRVLAKNVHADRDYPPFHRSARDGFAVRACDLPGEFWIVGETRAGARAAQPVGERQAVEIMTGAPMPEGADCVVMVEHVVRGEGSFRTDKVLKPGENFTRRGSESANGSVVLNAGCRIGYAEVATLAMVGRTEVSVYRKPVVAILPTGDEIVEAGERPEDFQIRNSNALSLAVQVARAGGVPKILPIARDNRESTLRSILDGLSADLLLLSGGVSAGKYDIVETVFSELGAEFYFDRVLIQPGQPLVFGICQGTQFFGLPGNPSSTMVTFEVFARAAVELLGGVTESPLPLMRARLVQPFRHKTGLTRFLPARLSADGAEIAHEPWQGSGDIPAIARANAFLVADADRESWAAGDDIRVLLK